MTVPHEDSTHKDIRGKNQPTRSVVVTLGPFHEKPWWWNHLQGDRELCPLDYERLNYRGKHSQDIPLLEIPIVMLKVLIRLISYRRRYDYIFTFECDLVGLSVAFWQSVLRMTRPRHVILQFIMREKNDTFRSAAKYALMKFLFASIRRVVVSSTAEVDYYTEVFGWPRGKARFVPFHTDPALLAEQKSTEGEYIFAAGRTFRDYDTLAEAVGAIGYSTIIVGGSGTRSRTRPMSNLKVMENIPQAELRELMRNARVVVVPLEDRKISAGQSVILEAMAVGKPVISTRTGGTVDYITDGVDGILVSPSDPLALKEALLRLDDARLRKSLGDAARARVIHTNLPRHYADKVRRALR